MFEAFRIFSMITAWVVGGGLIAVAALAVGWYFPRWREVAAAVAIGALSSTFFLAKGVHLGTEFTDAKWAAREQAVISKSVDARETAEQEVFTSTGGKSVGGHAVRLPNDLHDRDQH